MKKIITATVLSSVLLLTTSAMANEIKTVKPYNPFSSLKVYKFTDFKTKFFDFCNSNTKPENGETNQNQPAPDINIQPETNQPVPDTKPETNQPETPPMQEETGYAQQVLNLVNQERSARGLGALTLDNSLSNVAYLHSKDMSDNNFFSHNNLKGETPFDRIKKASISYKTAGENIAMGYKSPEAVVDGWMNSDGHRANILNASFTKMGLGYYNNYWTQLFIG